MKISEAIQEVDNLKPNEYGYEDKINWLSRLDRQIKLEIYDTHELLEDEAEIELNGYTADTPSDTELLVPAPYDEMYVHYLAAQIDYYNREYDGFQATNAMFGTCYDSFRNKYNATHRPKSTKKIYF